MKQLNRKLPSPRKITLALAAFLSHSVWASDNSLSGFTTTLSGGYHSHSETKQSLDNSNTLSLGVGYQFSSPWDLELSYLTSKPDHTQQGQDIDEEHLRLDALYYFDRKGAVHPYLVFGGGEAKYDLGPNKFDTTIINAGAGIKYLLSDHVALRSDLRAISYEEIGNTEAAFNFGLNFLLGSKQSSTSDSKPTPQTISPQKIDSDGDGISDELDKCDSTPANVSVDRMGCTVTLDIDSDGIPDEMDDCPDSEPGSKVTARGCYEELEETKTITLRLQFATNTTKVLNPDDPQLIALSNFMREYPQTEVILEGYTDSSGSEQYNLKLSKERATSVGDILTVKFGIPQSRISTTGFGEANPIADNSTPFGRSQNRRVEAKISTTVKTIVK